MSTEPSPASNQVDPAAVFGSALSLWKACHEYAKRQDFDLSECFNGIDQLMRVVMRIGDQFEAWSCQHVDFDKLTDVWPYMLEDTFGSACIAIVSPTLLDSFDNRDCLRIAMRMHLPFVRGANLPIPVDATASNPIQGSPFRMFRIQTVRDSNDERNVSAYDWNDDPFDETFGKPYFGLYGVFVDGTVEHIADRRTYPEAVSLAKKLVPGIEFSPR